MKTTKTTTFRAITISAAIFLGLNAGAASASASNSQFVSDGFHKYVVRFSDLDLSKVEGASALYSRLQHAAGIVCRSLESKDLGINAMYRSCVSHAVENAVTTVGQPMLSQIHESRTKGEKSALIQLARAN